MAARTPGAPEEKRLAGRRVTSVRRRHASRTGGRGKAAKIGDELPDLRIAEIGKWRHLRAAYAGADGAEQIRVGAAMGERAGQGRAAIAASLATRTVAALTQLSKERLAGADRGGTAGKRIGGWDALAGGNGGRTKDGEQEDSKSA